MRQVVVQGDYTVFAVTPVRIRTFVAGIAEMRSLFLRAKERVLRAKGKYEYWRTKDGLTLLSAWARDGLADDNIAKNIGISRSTLAEWKKRFSDISDALKKNKELADIVIENELYESCRGRTVTVKKPIKVKKIRVTKEKERFETEVIEYAEEEIYIPPNTTAQIFWLKNRRPDRWRDKPEEKGTDNMQEWLKNIQTMADLIKNPVPDRNIEDFE